SAGPSTAGAVCLGSAMLNTVHQRGRPDDAVMTASRCVANPIVRARASRSQRPSDLPTTSSTTPVVHELAEAAAGLELTTDGASTVLTDSCRPHTNGAR